MVCFSRVLALLLGNKSFKALGLTRVEVSIKKISNRKTISVIEDMLKFGVTLFLLLNAIIRYDVLVADYYKAVIDHPVEFSSAPSLDDVVNWTGDVTVSEVSDTNMSDYDTNKVEYNNSHEYELTVSGSTWFTVSSTADYGSTKSFPAGTYTAVVEAECIPL